MAKIAEIKEILDTVPIEQLPAELEKFKTDDRQGVKNLILKYQKTYVQYLAEKERSNKLLEYERKYAQYELIGGIDEVGRGPFAGPVVTACVILPKDPDLLYINDSKKLSEKKREELYDVIKEKALCIGIGMESPQVIDEINILQATYKAMRQAIQSMELKPRILLNDAVTIPEVSIPQVPIVKGDAKSMTIGAASIIAKVTRDRMMVEYDKIYPEYGFAKNKGYGSKEHIEALKKYGPCPIHRRSFIHNFVDVTNEWRRTDE